VSDADAVRALAERAFAHYVDRIGVRPRPMDADYAPPARAGELFVTGDPIDGAIVIRTETEPALVDVIAVEPEGQGRGVGRALMAAAERIAAGHGREELQLFTHVLMTENRAFYSALGYREIEVRTEHGFERVYLAKRL
jgi:GNAT superfamily N-acetyltransferase